MAAVGSNKLTIKPNDPEEKAFVQAAFQLGLSISKVRNDDIINFKYQGKQQASYKNLMTFFFSSERKMMSVVVRRLEDNKMIIYSKGSDSAILPLVTEGLTSTKEDLERKVERFGSEGLRVLCLAMRYLTPEESDEVL